MEDVAIEIKTPSLKKEDFENDEDSFITSPYNETADEKKVKEPLRKIVHQLNRKKDSYNKRYKKNQTYDSTLGILGSIFQAGAIAVLLGGVGRINADLDWFAIASNGLSILLSFIQVRLDLQNKCQRDKICEKQLNLMMRQIQTKIIMNGLTKHDVERIIDEWTQEMLLIEDTCDPI
jgi:hypothetical protein